MMFKVFGFRLFRVGVGFCFRFYLSSVWKSSFFYGKSRDIGFGKGESL